LRKGGVAPLDLVRQPTYAESHPRNNDLRITPYAKEARDGDHEPPDFSSWTAEKTHHRGEPKAANPMTSLTQPPRFRKPSDGIPRPVSPKNQLSHPP